MSYDRALTVFSPDGHLFQVEYAMEAVNKGTTVVGIRSRDTVVLAVEKKTVAKLQDPRTVKKIVQLDSHLWSGFSGLTADARILLNKARVECQSHRLTIEDGPEPEYIARYIAGVQQQYTQKGGVRPFGLCCMVIGFDCNGKGRLFLTEPSGIHSEWVANAIGRGGKSVKEYLEARVKVNEIDSYDGERVIRLAVEGLMEVVQTGPGGMEVAVLSASNPKELIMLSAEQIQAIVDSIDKERSEEAERRRTTGTR